MKQRILVTGGSGFIGIHLVTHLLALDYEVLNIDIVPPRDHRNVDCWRDISILDIDSLRICLNDFDPHFIIHLCAVTKQDSKDMRDFVVNIVGSENLLQVAKSLANLKKFISTSTQYVNTPGVPISDDNNLLVPYGLYGRSKLEAENYLIDNHFLFDWLIIRPTLIWGPWHPNLPNGLWKQLSKGRYVHPANDKVVKAYGFVENACWQIHELMIAPSSLTSQQVFYLGDENILQEKWVRELNSRISGRKLRYVPKSLIRMLSIFGSSLLIFGIKTPLYISRYRNLVTSNPIPLEKIRGLVGESPIGLQEAMDKTIKWYVSMNSLEAEMPENDSQS